MQTVLKLSFLFMFKLLFTAFLVTAASLTFAQKNKGPINWLSLQEADSLSKINPKPMFIDVYTDWCGWCKRMDATTFQDQNIANYLNANFYPVKLDAETKDSIIFQGKLFTNSQSITVRHILDSLKDDLTSLEVEIKSNDSLILSKVNAINHKLAFFELIKKTSLELESDSNKIKKRSKANFKSFKKSLKSEYVKSTFSKEEYKYLSKSLKQLKKAKSLSSLSEYLKPFKKGIKTNMDSITALNMKKVYNPIKTEFLQKKNQYSQFARRGRKSTHDVAIELSQGQMSYPTFILLFGDSLKANMPLKGFQKVPDLYGYLAFVAEGVFVSSRDVPGFVEEFKEVYTPGYEAPKDLVKWENFEDAIKAAKRDKKKIMVHIIHPQSVTSNLMDKESFREPSTAKKLNNNFHCVKLAINEKGKINYQGQELVNQNGIHQLALALSNNKLTFPHFAFLDSNGRIVMNVPQYFSKTKINPVIDYFTEDGYLKGTYGDWLQSKKN